MKWLSFTSGLFGVFAGMSFYVAAVSMILGMATALLDVPISVAPIKFIGFAISALAAMLIFGAAYCLVELTAGIIEWLYTHKED